MLTLLKRYWAVIRRPSVHFSLGFLTIGGFIGGILFWGAFNTAMELTNTEKFCTGCHEMRDNVFAELKSTIHYTNRSGVRAVCSNCHVPHDWTDKIAKSSEQSIRLKSSRPSGWSWRSTSGLGSRPTIRWSVATAITTTPWI